MRGVTGRIGDGGLKEILLRAEKSELKDTTKNALEKLYSGFSGPGIFDEIHLQLENLGETLALPRFLGSRAT
ncbi:MAG: hypothetical protein SFV17_15830 [Candidatus Obscuribacter sp.]|nr:hypothetical protein [Candidatus Melainabacteria bacterium]MDX1988154.1 hypothetical protein [Candidatus Obscuribacter sp.]